MKTQGFFAIDCRAWAEICDLGLNEAIAYLVLAQGTGANNRMTCWSATALRIYTGITWERAQAAIRRLVVKGFIGLAPGHSEKKPRYDILPWADVFPAVLEQKRSKLTEKDKRLLVNRATLTHVLPCSGPD